MKASVDVLLSEHYKLPRLHLWPSEDRDRRADVAEYIDGNGLQDPLLQATLLDRVMLEMKPLVWEIAEGCRASGDAHAHSALLEQEVYDRLQRELGANLKLYNDIAADALSEGDYSDFLHDVEGLLDAGVRTVSYYVATGRDAGHAL